MSPPGESASLSAYRAALTAPGAPVPALFSAVGRLPVAMYALATLLYVQGATGSFAAPGWCPPARSWVSRSGRSCRGA